MYERLLDPQLRQRVDWSRVHLWWGDERYVPRGDPLSNTFLADQALLADGGLPIPAGQVHPFPTDDALTGGLGPDWCAATYAAEVVGSVPLVDGWPSFDVVLVGIGGDGHVLSVFPDSLGASTSDRVALGDPAPTHIEPAVERVSLNPAILVVARRVLALASGAGKAAIVAQVLEGPRDPTRAAGRPRPALVGDVAARRAGCGRTGRGPPIRRDQRGRPGPPPAGCIDRCRRRGRHLAGVVQGDLRFPLSHTDDEVRAWIRDELLPGTETWLAIDPDGTTVGFMWLGLRADGLSRGARRGRGAHPHVAVHSLAAGSVKKADGWRSGFAGLYWHFVDIVSMVIVRARLSDHPEVGGAWTG